MSFYISQNNDFFIINGIKDYFKAKHKVGIHKDIRSKSIHFRISLSGFIFRSKIIDHLANYPLLGAKDVSYKL
jgi:hypothetical protein